jgi:hypothetical protein
MLRSKDRSLLLLLLLCQLLGAPECPEGQAGAAARAGGQLQRRSPLQKAPAGYPVVAAQMLQPAGCSVVAAVELRVAPEGPPEIPALRSG